MTSIAIKEKVIYLSKSLRDKKLKLVTAESCTGGMIASYITELPRASEIFERGFISYSNESKIELLTVPTFFIEKYGAVSEPTAIAMAEGALIMSQGNISISVTGIAGPDGGSKQKPVGTVFIAIATKNPDMTTICKEFLFKGDRNKIRLQSVEAALDMLITLAKNI